MLKTTLLAGAAVLGFAMSGTAHAATYNWNFTSNSNSDGFEGNTRTFTGGGMNVTASAYSTSSSSNSLSREALGRYETGLGVTTSSSDTHYVDNSSRYDLVVFEFASAVDLATVILTSYGDADISVWIGNKTAGNNFEGTETFNNNLGGLTFIGHYDCDGTQQGGGNCDDDGEVISYNINAGNVLGNYLVIAARFGSGSDSDGEEFKIRGLSADPSAPPPTTNVSEPGTLAAFGIGLAALGYLGRRRKSA